MASQTICYSTKLPKDIIDIIEKDILENNHSNKVHSDIPISSEHWINEFIMHYVNISNRKNFLYDISGIDPESLRYKIYNKGDFDNWCTIQNKNNVDHIKKLSFYLILSDSEDYEGGNIQMLNESRNLYLIPRKRGVLAIFDSFASHRILKINKGTKKIIVGSCIGPHWI